VGVAARTVRAPDGREWQVRVRRFRPPRWRQGEPLFTEDPDPWLFGIGDVVLGLVSAVLGLLVSIVIVAVELPVNAFRALFSDGRTVEAVSRSPQAIQLTWRTDAEHAAAVADQVARQLELGYDRVEPHNAAFEGFGDE
jgi:hypothetical protein